MRPVRPLRTRKNVFFSLSVYIQHTRIYISIYCMCTSSYLTFYSSSCCCSFFCMRLLSLIQLSSLSEISCRLLLFSSLLLSLILIVFTGFFSSSLFTTGKKEEKLFSILISLCFFFFSTLEKISNNFLNRSL